MLFFLKHTFNNQFSQRYRNNRRERKNNDKDGSSPNITRAIVKVRASQPAQSSSSGNSVVNIEMETYEENVTALAKLINGKHYPPAKVVEELLDATRILRKKWLDEEVSIRQILDKYPCFKNPKWVSRDNFILSLKYNTCVMLYSLSMNS